MKKLLIFLKDYKKETVLAPLFKMLEAGFELFVPLVIAVIIDQGIGGSNYAAYEAGDVMVGNMHIVLRMGGLLIALGIIGLVCSITAQYYAAKAAVGFSTQVKHALFAHIEKLSFSEMDKLGTSTMITRMTSDINQMQNGVNMVLRLFLRSPFIVFGAMIMAFTIDAKAALVFVVTIILLSAVVFGIMGVTIPLYKKVQAGLDEVLGRTRENLTGVRVIRAFHKEKQETEAFEQSNSALTAMQLFVGKLSALTNPVTYIIVNVATIALIYTGAVQVDRGSITQGEVVALVNYMSQILVELVKLANLVILVTKALACANRVQSVFEMQSSMEWKKQTADSGAAQLVGRLDAQVSEDDYVVEFDHVSLTYQGAGAEALTDIDFRVKKGQTIGVIGGTGSGKSSLVHLIPRFYDVTKGSVKVDGVDVRDYGMDELREKIGIVMQKAVLFRGTIRDNLRWGNEDAATEEMNKALEISQAKEFVDAKPKGLDEPIAQGGKNLSGGQRQRLTIARAVVKQPEILILDDSASALDYATDAKLRQAIRGMNNTTVFIVSQRTSSIQHADQIIVLEDGRVADIGTHEELLAGCEVYQEIYYSQTKRTDGA
ncbi:MAG: ABC transporter ATP-binding protein [Lachnospiraceae bacterium]|nr:ABC transporter ATP-binding protein [Lachnospiraceae bacterium]